MAVLMTAFFCVGCDSGTPQPIHLDDGDSGLGLIFNRETKTPRATSSASSSILDDLTSSTGPELSVPYVEGFDTQSLYEQYRDLETRVAQCLKGEGESDATSLLSDVSQMNGVVSVASGQVKTSQAQGSITEEEADSLDAFYTELKEGLSELADDLKS